MKVQQGSATIKMIARECRNQKYCHNQKIIKKMQQSKVLPKSITSKGYTRECRNHGSCKAVPQKTAYRECYKSILRECHNQKYCQKNPQKYQEVSQSKVLPGTTIIKSTARDATIKSTARECHNKVHPGSATNRSTTRGCHNQNDH